MNTRALYWATKSIIEALYMLGSLIGLFFTARSTDPEWFGGLQILLWSALLLWSGRDMKRALGKLKAEANDDTRRQGYMPPERFLK